MLQYTPDATLRTESGFTNTVQVELGTDAINRLETQAEGDHYKLAAHLRRIWELAFQRDGELRPCPIRMRKLGVRVVSVGVSPEMFAQIETIRQGNSRSGFLRALTLLGANTFDQTRPEVANG